MQLIYRQHAVRRMFERHISTADVGAAPASGRVIEDYPTDTPYPSCLWLGFAGNRPLHLLFADKPGDGERVIITVYEPDSALWLADLATRKNP
ncbi:DUF4258 domain-containing protein [Candidatus Accumulibacter sp. ACC003]|uniref:DUF4258 domain-containing protein n=1 Tax=Candidatus Accumulibacter sp. ACC003 TaxID=2823334 RepID=UPI0025BED8F6|nr:DUF4258 domain-containing protein [Candidatus Accumulibacter sp. ACC003]